MTGKGLFSLHDSNTQHVQSYVDGVVKRNRFSFFIIEFLCQGFVITKNSAVTSWLRFIVVVAVRSSLSIQNASIVKSFGSTIPGSFRAL